MLTFVLNIISHAMSWKIVCLINSSFWYKTDVINSTLDVWNCYAANIIHYTLYNKFLFVPYYCLGSWNCHNVCWLLMWAFFDIWTSLGYFVWSLISCVCITGATFKWNISNWCMLFSTILRQTLVLEITLTLANCYCYWTICNNY